MLVPRLIDRGYKFVTLTEMLCRNQSRSWR